MNRPRQFGTTLGLARSLVIYYGQPWRRRALRRFYKEIITPGDLAFDIGAHVGSRAKTLLSLGADVVAVEPQPAFAEFLDRRFRTRLRALERVAVGSGTGAIDLRISSRHPTVSSTSDSFIEEVSGSDGFRMVDWDQRIRVPVTTLDHLIERHGKPAFCKIDVEGAEAEILKGLSKPLNLIAFEYIPAMPSVAVEAIQRLEALGSYRYNRVIGEQHRFVEPDWVSAADILGRLSELHQSSPSGDIYARLVR